MTSDHAPPKLTLVLVPGTAASCTSWILGCWAGSATSEVEWSSACASCTVTCIVYYHYLSIYHYCIIVTCHIVTYYYCFLLLHCYYIIIMYYYIISSYCYCFCYYTVITSLFLIITYSLSPIIKTSLLEIITSLSHYYFIIPNYRNML